MLKHLRGVTNAIGVGLFALLFLVFVVQVVARFGFNKPLAWTDEAAVILYVWAILWASALVCSDRENVAFDLLYQKARPPVHRVMALAACALIGVLAAWGLPGSLDYIHFMQREKSPVMGLPFHWIFAPFGILLLALALRCGLRIYHLLGRHWRHHL